MKEYLFYLLTVIGIGYFLTTSDLAKPFREWVAKINEKKVKFKPLNFIWDKFDGVVSCIYCASFWIGIAVFFIINKQFNIDTIFNAFSVMGFIYVAKTISNK
jgi:hypothetical protein